MTFHRIAIWAVSAGLVYGTSLPTSASSGGFSGVGSAPCDSGGQNITGTFSSKGAKYFTTGTCTTKGSLGAPFSFPFKAEGRFADNIAVETIEVRPAPINQPGHVYGTWTTTYSCQVDPWLAPDPFPSKVLEPAVKCQTIARNDFSPTWGPSKGGKPDKPLDRLFAAWREHKPITSYYLTPPQRAALAAKREQDFRTEAEAVAKAEAEQRRAVQLQQGAMSPPASYRMALAPIVRWPVTGQKFPARTTVSIKLAPPPQWADTSFDIITGSPIKTPRSVTGYLVRVERKDAAGHWVAQTTLPIGVMQADSAGGFTGFGAGAPPGGLPCREHGG